MYVEMIWRRKLDRPGHLRDQITKPNELRQFKERDDMTHQACERACAGLKLTFRLHPL